MSDLLMRLDRIKSKLGKDAAARIRELETEVRQLQNQWTNSCDLLNTVEAERDAARLALEQVNHGK